jgi:hypothetical protein
MKFEYRILRGDAPVSAKQLNEEYGPKGWELVDIVVTPDEEFYHYFKRQIDA